MKFIEAGLAKNKLAVLPVICEILHFRCRCGEGRGMERGVTSHYIYIYIQYYSSMYCTDIFCTAYNTILSPQYDISIVHCNIVYYFSILFEYYICR